MGRERRVHTVARAVSDQPVALLSAQLPAFGSTLAACFDLDGLGTMLAEINGAVLFPRQILSGF